MFVHVACFLFLAPDEVFPFVVSLIPRANAGAGHQSYQYSAGPSGSSIPYALL